jgi:hypothetical protein
VRRTTDGGGPSSVGVITGRLFWSVPVRVSWQFAKEERTTTAKTWRDLIAMEVGKEGSNRSHGIYCFAVRSLLLITLRVHFRCNNAAVGKPGCLHIFV